MLSVQTILAAFRTRPGPDGGAKATDSCSGSGSTTSRSAQTRIPRDALGGDELNADELKHRAVPERILRMDDFEARQNAKDAWDLLCDLKALASLARDFGEYADLGATITENAQINQARRGEILQRLSSRGGRSDGSPDGHGTWEDLALQRKSDGEPGRRTPLAGR